MIATYELNTKKNGIEITFEGCPSESIRDMMKINGYRWHNKKKVWYAKHSEWREKIAGMVCRDAAAEKVPQNVKQAVTKAKAAPANKYGVKVGDIFSASWGYEQTNNDFFQVVALVGKASVRVREVYPELVNETAISSMAADRIYKNTGEMLTGPESSMWINDQQNGDLKRLKSYAADGVSNPQIKIRDYMSAYLETDETIKVYDSWYY